MNSDLPARPSVVRAAFLQQADAFVGLMMLACGLLVQIGGIVVHQLSGVVVQRWEVTLVAEAVVTSLLAWGAAHLSHRRACSSVKRYILEHTVENEVRSSIRKPLPEDEAQELRHVVRWLLQGLCSDKEVTEFIKELMENLQRPTQHP
jgi:hypothetical protein